MHNKMLLSLHQTVKSVIGISLLTSHTAPPVTTSAESYLQHDFNVKT